MNSKTNAIVNFIAEEFSSFIYILSVVMGALLGGVLVASIPLCAILVNAIVNFIAEEFSSFIYILSVVMGALLGGVLVASIPLCAILVGFYNL